MKYLLYTLFALMMISCGRSSKATGPLNLTDKPAFYDEPNRFNLDSLKKRSLEQNKPILLYFTGFGMVNCRKMEDKLLADEDIHNTMHEKFICQELYMDDKNNGNQNKWILKESCMIHSENPELPLFLILDPRDLNDSCIDSIQEIGNCGYTLEKLPFMTFLETGLDTYAKGPK